MSANCIEAHWKGIEKDACIEINQVAILKKLKKGEALYLAEQEPLGIYIIKSGLLALTSISCDGQEQILRLYAPSNFAGHRAYLTGDKYLATAVALSESEVYFIPKNEVEPLFKKHPCLLRSIAKYLAGELREAERKFRDVTSKRVEQRIAETVLFLKMRYPDHNFTRREIAEYCGTTTATVIRTLGRFEEMGIIDQSRRDIKFLDTEKLKEMAALPGC